ncbi:MULTISPECIES: hypothetical protein [Actinoalloteichus]|uniref:Uncharacterized protein n=1 Tax=Actinoalloteichus fjordicus TaxID=1612552 RepID=A0AAC9L792_9PSEU|nr:MULTISPECIES: hypothetical protein [Actinoalloteichus]APU12166.1 hypothetical protein UA74_00330 [Actinoalloteichus fjordicus]APU18118.1 hypothetical protein UA75_00330 [Actinoalloteichus sp. GBA129-24]
MTWQDELRRLDTALAAGDISQSEHQDQRDAVLSIAAGSRAGSPFDTQLTLRNQPIAALSTDTQTAAQGSPTQEAASTTSKAGAGTASIAQAFAGSAAAASATSGTSAPEADRSAEAPAPAEQEQIEQARTEQVQPQQDPAAQPPAQKTTGQESATSQNDAAVSAQPTTPGDSSSATTAAASAQVPGDPTPATQVQEHPAPGHVTTGAPVTGTTAPATTPPPGQPGAVDPQVRATGPSAPSDGAPQAQTLGARLGAVMQDHPSVHQSDQEALALPSPDQSSRQGPYAGRAEEVFNAQNARPRRKLLPMLVVAIVVVAVLAAGAFWFFSQDGSGAGDATVPPQGQAQGQGDEAAPPPAGDAQPNFPVLPGAPAPHPEAMSREAAVNAGVLGESEAAALGDHGIAEIFFRGSVDGDNAFGVLVGVAPTADAALAGAEALSFGQTELGLSAVAMEGVPAQVRIFEQVGEEQSIHRAVYVSGEYVVRIGVAGPTNGEGEPVDTAFRTLADETMQALEQN